MMPSRGFINKLEFRHWNDNGHRNYCTRFVVDEKRVRAPVFPPPGKPSTAPRDSEETRHLDLPQIQS